MEEYYDAKELITLFDVIKMVNEEYPPKKIKIVDIDEQSNDTFIWHDGFYENEDGCRLEEEIDILGCLYYDVKILEEK